MNSKLAKMLVLGLVILAGFALTGCSGVNTGTPEWKAAESIYRLYITTPDSQLNLDEEEKMSDQYEALLSELAQTNKLFVADSSNFSEYDGKKQYEHNQISLTAMGIDFDENIDPNGKCLTVSVRYFDFNPIKTVSGLSIEDCLAEDDNTLNVLVPVQYKDQEERIVALYKSYFYFQKITVGNIYNEDAGRPLNATQESDLNVNIIYVNDNQRYFTFNPKIAQNTNNVIVDPMVIIYDYKVHSSYAYAYAGLGSFFPGSSDEQALESIQPATKRQEGIGHYILGVRLASKHHLPW